MTIILIIALLLGFLLVHIIKLMRLYLILIDRKIPFERFVPAYLRTTFVNLIIPFKLGEIYRIGVFYKIAGDFKTGFFSVVVDRFFDTLAIIMILLPYQLMISRTITLPAILLSVFIVVIVIAYMIFPSSYRFLNGYIITSKNSSRSLAVLKGLEVVNEWYEYVRMLVIGRYGLIVLLSLAAWILEISVLAGVEKLCGLSFSVADFGAYIESIISGATYNKGALYSSASIIVIGIATIISLIVYIAVFRIQSGKSANRK